MNTEVPGLTVQNTPGEHHRILLTGATGFLGSHLAEAFLASGHEVHALLRRQSKTGKISQLIHKLKIHYTDESLGVIFSRNHFDTVVHTACC